MQAALQRDSARRASVVWGQPTCLQRCSLPLHSTRAIARPLNSCTPTHALQVWLGRASMGLFGLLLAYETLHSNRPLFGTFFYTWF